MKKFHLVKYVYNSEPRLIKFSSLKAMNSFIKDYKEEHKDMEYDGFWIDFSITNITGKLTLEDKISNLPVEEV